MFFGNYIFYSDFFTKDNQFKIFYTRRHGPIKIKDTPWFKLESEGVSRNTAERLFHEKFKSDMYMNSRHMSWNLNKYVCEYAFHLFHPYIESTSKLRFRKYDSYMTDVHERSTLHFMHLVSGIQCYLQLAVPSNITHHFTHQLNHEQFKILFDSKPKIFCINDLDEESKSNWIEFQKLYFSKFTNPYDGLKKKIKDALQKEKKHHKHRSTTS
jgi:hypothetical protein